MKKLVNTILVSSVLFSCGKKAEDINLESKLLPTVGYQAISTKEVDPIVRSVTLISYPLESDMEGFEYHVPEKTFNAVFNSKLTRYSSANGTFSSDTQDTVKYGKNIQNGIKKSATNFNKVSEFVRQINLVGDSRDKAYSAFVDNQKIVNKISKVVDVVEQQVQTEVTFYKIREGEFKNKYVLRELEDVKVRKQKTKSCDQMMDRRIPKLEASLILEEEQALIDALVAQCKAIKPERAKLEKVEETQKEIIFSNRAIPSSSIFYQGKTYITNMLKGLGIHANKFFLSTGVYKESYLDGSPVDGEEFSKIVFLQRDELDSAQAKVLELDRKMKANRDARDRMDDPTVQAELDAAYAVLEDEYSDAKIDLEAIQFKFAANPVFEKFSLNLDILDTGFKIYSLENGLITNFKSRTSKQGALVVSFDMISPKAIVSVELGQTLMGNFGVRLVGEAKFKFKSGRETLGVMKIELDTKDIQSFPVDFSEL